MRCALLLSIAAAAMVAGCSTTAPQMPAEAKLATAPKPEPLPLPYRWTHGHSEKAHKAMLANFGKAGLKTGDYVWAKEVPAAGEPRVIIDLLTQTAYAYRGDVLVGAASISSAKKGKETPLGFWKVLQKKKFHRSRKYNNAPMPFMQRIDEFGIALHGGKNPGYPASQGCVRMPMKFAEKLYGLTGLGTEVIIEG
jgi:lipoprotein-anchoring transpeptidase ErfK/SrfK